MNDLDNETWLLDAGDCIIEKKAKNNYASLLPLERLIYCFWLADYGLRNAGDLMPAAEIHPTFFEEGKQISKALKMSHSIAAFSLSMEEFQKQYFDFFDAIISELKAAYIW